MKILNGILAVLFLTFALVQINDPDPLVWILVYSAVSVVSGFAIFNRYNSWVLIAGMIGMLVWAGVLLPEVFQWVMDNPNAQIDITKKMDDKMPFIEIAREFFGLLICFFALSFHFYRARKIKKSVNN